MGHRDIRDIRIDVLKAQGKTLSEFGPRGLETPKKTTLMSLTEVDWGDPASSDESFTMEVAGYAGAEGDGDSATESYNPFTESDSFDLVTWQRDAHASPLVWTGLTEDGSVIDKHDLQPFEVKGARKPLGFLVTYDEWVRRMRLAGKWVDPTPGFEWTDAA